MFRLRQISVDGELRQQRSAHLRERLHQQEQQRHHHRAAIRPQIRDQPPHQPAVICFSEDFFFQSLSVAQLNLVSLPPFTCLVGFNFPARVLNFSRE